MTNVNSFLLDGFYRKCGVETTCERAIRESSGLVVMCHFEEYNITIWKKKW